MKTVRLISLIARVALMVTLTLGLVFWIAQLFGWIGLLVFLAQIGFPGIHEAFGTIGVLGLFILGSVAVFTKGSRWLGVGSILYAFLVPAFGMTQTLILVGNLHWLIQTAHLLVGIGAMVLILRIEKRYRRLKLKEHGGTTEKPLGRPYPPIVARLARLAISAHVALYRLSGGTIAGRVQHMPALLLTTTGRKSGKQHTTPLVYLADGDGFVVVASNGGQGKLPNWWLNLRKSKQAHIEIGRCSHCIGDRSTYELRQFCPGRDHHSERAKRDTDQRRSAHALVRFAALCHGGLPLYILRAGLLGLIYCSLASGCPPDRAIQEVVVVQLLGRHQFLQRRLPTAEAL